MSVQRFLLTKPVLEKLKEAYELIANSIMRLENKETFQALDIIAGVIENIEKHSEVIPEVIGSIMGEPDWSQINEDLVCPTCGQCIPEKSILDKICEKMIEFEIKTGITPNTIFLGKKEESEMKVHFRKPIVKNLQYEGAMVLIVDTDSCVKVS